MYIYIYINVYICIWIYAYIYIYIYMHPTYIHACHMCLYVGESKCGRCEGVSKRVGERVRCPNVSATRLFYM